MESKTLLDLLNTVFTIIENGLFSVGEHRKRKLLHRFKSLTKWRCLQVNGATFLSCSRVKILQLRVEFNQSFIDLLNLPPDGLPTDLKLG